MRWAWIALATWTLLVGCEAQRQAAGQGGTFIVEADCDDNTINVRTLVEENEEAAQIKATGP